MIFVILKLQVMFKFCSIAIKIIFIFTKNFVNIQECDAESFDAFFTFVARKLRLS